MFKVGCRVRVLRGRNFESFSQREEGIIKDLDDECRNCQVIFDSRVEPVRVALKHLRVIEAPPGQEAPLDRSQNIGESTPDAFANVSAHSSPGLSDCGETYLTRRASARLRPRRASISEDILESLPAHTDSSFEQHTASSRALQVMQRRCQQLEEQAECDHRRIVKLAESCEYERERGDRLEKQLEMIRTDELRADLIMARSEAEVSVESCAYAELRGELQDVEALLEGTLRVGAETADRPVPRYLLMNAESKVVMERFHQQWNEAVEKQSFAFQQAFCSSSAQHARQRLFEAASQDNIVALKDALGCEFGEGRDAVEVLMTARDEQKRSVMHVALANGAKEVTRHLIVQSEHWANRCRHWQALQIELVQRSLATTINSLDDCGRSPLLTLCRCSDADTEIAAALLAVCGNPLQRDIQGMTPFLECARLGHVDIAHMLLEAAGTMLLSDADTRGRTPLHWAVEMQHHHFVDFLLKFGAPLDLPDMYGYSPLELALMRNHKDIADILSGRMANAQDYASKESSGAEDCHQDSFHGLAPQLSPLDATDDRGL